MYDTTPAFRAAVVGSHRAFSYIEILGVGEHVEGVLGGSVKLEAEAAIRGSVSFSVIDPTGRYLERGKTGDLLSRFGSEVRPWRGVVFDDGTTEAVPLGTFRIDTNDPTENGNGFELAFTGRDRSSIVARKPARSIVITNGTPLNEALRTIIGAMSPGAAYHFVDNRYTTGTMLIETSDNPWEQAQALCSSSGILLFCDRMGVFCTQPGLDPNSSALWLFDEGERCTFTGVPSVSKGTGQAVPNGYVVKANSSGSNSSGVRGEAWDLDPNSPTYRYGRYGASVETVESEKVKTNEQAQRAADLLLRRALGKSITMGFSALPNPALDPFDIVRARRSALGIDDLFYLASYEIPLEVGGQAQGTLNRHLPAADAMVDRELRELLGSDEVK